LPVSVPAGFAMNSLMTRSPAMRPLQAPGWFGSSAAGPQPARSADAQSVAAPRALERSLRFMEVPEGEALNQGEELARAPRRRTTSLQAARRPLPCPALR